MKQLEVQIMQQSYLLGCPEGREARLLDAVERVDTAMTRIRDAGKVRARERIAVLAALMASLSGWLYAHLQRSVSATPFGLHMGIEYLFMAVIGGVGHVWGAIVGATVVKVLEEQLHILIDCFGEVLLVTKAVLLMLEII